MELTNANPQKVLLTVDDLVLTGRLLHFRQWWHLAPGLRKSWLGLQLFEAPTAQAIETDWHKTWFSEGFGQRSSRQSFCISGLLPPGTHQLRFTLPLSADSLEFE